MGGLFLGKRPLLLQPHPVTSPQEGSRRDTLEFAAMDCHQKNRDREGEVLSSCLLEELFRRYRASSRNASLPSHCLSSPWDRQQYIVSFNRMVVVGNLFFSTLPGSSSPPTSKARTGILYEKESMLCKRCYYRYRYK